MKKNIGGLSCLFLTFVLFSVSAFADTDYENNKEYIEIFQTTLEKAKNGDVVSQFNIADYYREGFGVRKDLDASLKWIITAAENNNLRAQIELIEIYSKGEEIPKNEKEALKWLLKITEQANKSDLKSKLYLGFVNIEGKIIPQNIPEAIKLFTEAANENDTLAQYTLGKIYDEGKDVPQSYAEAVKWYRMAAENGYNSDSFHAIKSCIRLSIMYSSGVGVKQNDQESDKLYKLISEKGETGELLSIANNNYIDDDKDKVNVNTALKLFKIVAGRKDINKLNKLGDIYKEGLIVPLDYKEAIRWYRAAALLHDAVAQNKLGDLYIEGHGIPQNYKEAMKWYRLAADQGDSGALFSLGRMYYKGEGVPKNTKEAVRLYELSSQKIKKEILSDIESGTSPAIIGMKKNSLTFSQSVIGNLYRDGGNGLAKDYVKAYAWYTLAAANGHEKVQERMDGLAKQMKPAQINAAQKLANELWEK